MKKPMSKTKKKLYMIYCSSSLGRFLFSAYKLISIYYLNYQEGKEKDAVQEVAKVPKNPEKEDFTIDWKALKEKNPEVVGWILIPDTDISYPIVQGSDNSYYLNHTFEKKENYAGAIFMDAGADASFQDRNTIIYGHNVKHGTMFAELEKFKEQAFFEQHPYLYIFTEQQNYRCEIFSMYSTSATSASYRLQYADEGVPHAHELLERAQQDRRHERTVDVAYLFLGVGGQLDERRRMPTAFRLARIVRPLPAARAAVVGATVHVAFLCPAIEDGGPAALGGGEERRAWPLAPFLRSDGQRHSIGERLIEHHRIVDGDFLGRHIWGVLADAPTVRRSQSASRTAPPDASQRAVRLPAVTFDPRAHQMPPTWGSR